MENPSYLPWVVPLLPLLGFLFNALFGARADKKVSGGIATAVVWAAFAVSVALFLQVPGAADKRLFSTPFDWIALPSVAGSPGLDLRFSLTVDPLSALMLLIITGVGALIHGYSMGYMSHDKGYSRYFGYLNLFVFFMLLLVMASNFVVMFIGWEGVGLASYLLIGFWSEKKSATDAAKKAFIVNRVGDAALLIALFLLFQHFGTFEFFGPGGILTADGLGAAAQNGYVAGALVATAVPILLFVGATGKSAQIPLYVWLPDAMEGPTPVSALIHAATMVTAGVYLLTRAHALFLLSPVAMSVVAVVGAATALLAATIGLAQNDIKKVLAYSTISQLGYMFLACGVGAFGAAMFHVTTHAFFKALLFLGSGSVIHAMGGEQDMRKMGGLAGKIKTTYLTMFVGTLAIAGIFPLAGFWSKDEILGAAFAKHPALWAIGFVTAALTAFYMWRMMGKTFLGQMRCDTETASHVHESPASMLVPLQVLAVLSAVAGFLNAPLLGLHVFSHWLGESAGPEPKMPEGGLNLGLVGASALLAIGVSWWAWNAYKKAKDGNRLTEEQKAKSRLYALVRDKWQVDEAYDAVIVAPGRRLALGLWRIGDRLAIDGVVEGVGGTVAAAAEGLRRLQNGYVRSYALTVVVGVVLVVVGCLVGLAQGGR